MFSLPQMKEKRKVYRGHRLNDTSYIRFLQKVIVLWKVPVPKSPAISQTHDGKLSCYSPVSSELPALEIPDEFLQISVPPLAVSSLLTGLIKREGSLSRRTLEKHRSNQLLEKNFKLI
ncbi:hypothetical protein [Bacillus amyloliquefaciens]|uniref:hypothetical protein n=1 Tax=Bacillus amyloliquefaciens TaxID=1390 RepID=UPI00128FC7E2|nr:hypothetical protein [Bacillus amyloliquefaciens]